jgi:transcriptional regulator with XRE-family HTH domain
MASPRSFDEYEDFFGPYLGPILVRARKERDMSQVALAEKLRISDATLRRIETGLGPMRPRIVASICKALDLRLDDVVLEALFSFWKDFQRRATEGGGEDSANVLGPYQRLRERILDKFDAHVRSRRELMEADLDLQAFIHFKLKLDGLDD